MAAKVGLIDYGAGNFGSVYNALNSLDIDVLKVRDAKQLQSVNHIILPGVGAFGAVMEKLHEFGIIDPLREAVIEQEKFYLGICVGMQVLAELGTEFVDTEGLGFISGKVIKIPVDKSLRLPHIGWNTVTWKENNPLFQKIEGDTSFYFVHSYHFVPKDKVHCSAWTEYGGEVTASVSSKNIFGVQFHPEKSQRNGLQLLENFATL